MISEQLQRAIWAAIEPYRGPLIDLVEGRLTPEQFETGYLSAYSGNDDSGLSDEVFTIVDRFFFDVDAYVGDPDLRSDVHGAIGPDELLDRARELLRHAGYDVAAAHRG